MSITLLSKMFFYPKQFTFHAYMTQQAAKIARLNNNCEHLFSLESYFSQWLNCFVFSAYVFIRLTDSQSHLHLVQCVTCCGLIRQRIMAMKKMLNISVITPSEAAHISTGIIARCCYNKLDCFQGYSFNVYVVIQFYPWFKFHSPLFQTHYHTFPCPKTKENKI